MVGYIKTLQMYRGDLEENPLQIGEVVQLKSGGPAMTVVGMDEGQMVVCWADAVGQMHSDKFRSVLLQRVRKSFFARRR